jgi:uncharacterized membrane protein
VIFHPALPPILVLVLLLLAGILFLLVEMRVLAYAYRKVGVRPRSAFAVMILSLVGSHVNIPLYSLPVERLIPPHEVRLFGRVYMVPETIREGTTVVAVNVGGALIPFLVSLYLFVRSGMDWRFLLGIAVVAVVVNRLAHVVPGVGIVVPMIVPPLVAAGVSLLLAVRRAPPIAYVSGSMGALVGADLVNLVNIGDLGAPIVSIGGAGTFDGVFLTGIIAGLLV